MFKVRILSLIKKKKSSSNNKWTAWLSLCVLFISSSRGDGRVLCYYANWSETRNASYRLYPWNIDINLCTHVVYAFAMPDLSEGVVPLDFLNTLNDNAKNEFVNLKRERPDLTLMLSIGGWQEGSRDFSQISADPSAVKWITEILCQKIRNVGFDGLDINWQWPVPGLREGSNSADRENFSNLIKVMREYFILEGQKSNRPPLLLSIVLPPFQSYAEKGFDLKQLLGLVDFVNLHSMDYHVSTSAEVNHLAPLYAPTPSSIPEPTVDSTVKMYLGQGIDPSMMNLGIPFYGYSYELQDEAQHNLKSPADEEGAPGFGINTQGMLAYFEICKYIIDEKWTVNWPNKTAVGPYAFHNKRWVGFDDPESIKKKVQYAVDNHLGGITLMTIDMDDFNGICRERFPLTKAAANAFNAAKEKPKTSNSQTLSIETRPNTDRFFNQENCSHVIDTETAISNEPGFNAPPSLKTFLLCRDNVSYETPKIVKAISPTKPAIAEPQTDDITSTANPFKQQINNELDSNALYDLLYNQGQVQKKKETEAPYTSFKTPATSVIPIIRNDTTSSQVTTPPHQHQPVDSPQLQLSANNNFNMLHYYKTNASFLHKITKMAYNFNKFYN